jgi:ribosomal protein S18 acetylase RimI-like enzyme
MLGEQGRKMVGLTRVITDGVTFGYMTDVYVLPDYQRRGLGRWMMVCLNEILREWKAMRGFWLLSGNPQATKLYESVLGTESIGSCRVSSSAPELSVLAKFGEEFARN